MKTLRMIQFVAESKAKNYDLVDGLDINKTDAIVVLSVHHHYIEWEFRYINDGKTMIIRPIVKKQK